MSHALIVFMEEVKAYNYSDFRSPEDVNIPFRVSHRQFCNDDSYTRKIIETIKQIIKIL